MSQFPRDEYTAYPEIVIMRNPAQPRVDWIARIYCYQPVGFIWQGNMLAEWPENLPEPVYPEFPHQGTREQITAWRAQCAAIAQSHPQAYHVIDKVDGYIESADVDAAEAEARRVSQNWVAERMANYRRQ
jgi:hypothetical protein